MRIKVFSLSLSTNRINEKGLVEIEVSILVFLNGILLLNIRSGKIRINFVESNSWDKKKFWMMDGNTYIPFKLTNIPQKYIWLLLSPIFHCLDYEHA